MAGMIHETAIVEDGAKIGEGTRIWHHAHVRSGSDIGSGCNIGKNYDEETHCFSHGSDHDSLHGSSFLRR